MVFSWHSFCVIEWGILNKFRSWFVWVCELGWLFPSGRQRESMKRFVTPFCLTLHGGYVHFHGKSRKVSGWNAESELRGKLPEVGYWASEKGANRGFCGFQQGWNRGYLSLCNSFVPLDANDGDLDKLLLYRELPRFYQWIFLNFGYSYRVTVHF